MTLFTVFFLNISIRFGEAHLGEAATEPPTIGTGTGAAVGDGFQLGGC